MTDETTHIYPPGTVLLMSEGEYSDFGYCGQLVTLKQINLADLINVFKMSLELNGEVGEGGTYDNGGASDFVAWLIVTECAMPLACSEVHIGSYGRLEL